MKRYRHIICSFISLALLTLIASCSADKMPVYFEPAGEDSAGDPSTSDPSLAGSCSITYESQCVAFAINLLLISSLEHSLARIL